MQPQTTAMTITISNNERGIVSFLFMALVYHGCQ